MHRNTRIGSNRSRLCQQVVSKGKLALALASFTLMGCSDVLSVEDPDIINPGDVQSPAGAEALRVGTLARLNSATSGAESLFLLGGLFADEWNNGDSFIARQEIDQRSITPENNFLTTANRWLHRALLSAEQTIQSFEEHSPNAPSWQSAEMHFVQAYIVNLMAEHYCDGMILSTVVDGHEQYGSPMSTADAFDQALQYADDGLNTLSGTSADDDRIRHALQVTRGRILMNLDRAGEAAAAVDGVPTDFEYLMRHSQSTNSNEIWSMNNLAGRYSVSDGEGINGVDFATANDPRVPVCEGGDAECSAIGVTLTQLDDRSEHPYYVQMLWPTRESPVAIVAGTEARLIEAEAQLRDQDPDWLNTLDGLRSTVAGLGSLSDPGSESARQDLLFRERAFWLFGRGHRVGDLRRLIRQYERPAEDVFPTGSWHKGGNYGQDVNLPVPQAEENNPNLPRGQACLNRDA